MVRVRNSVRGINCPIIHRFNVLLLLARIIRRYYVESYCDIRYL